MGYRNLLYYPNQQIIQKMKTKLIILATTLLVLTAVSCKQANKETVKEEFENSSDNEAIRVFSSTLTWNNTKFDINIQNDTLFIQPSGLEASNDSFFHPILGQTVVGTEIVDLDGDQHAEILVFLTSDGSGSYGNVIAYSVNNGKSMSQITYNAEGDSEEIKQGYMGHDSFTIQENKLQRSFPIYKENDTNANPTGGKRTILYKLEQGPNSKLLVVDQISMQE